MTEKTGQDVDMEKALLDPEDVFGEPEAVLAHPGLTKQQKIEVLRRWRYDASEVAVAEEEGMPGDRPLMTRRVALALVKLTGGVEERHGSPTKQDGN